MTIRPERLSRLCLNDGSHRFSWLMRFKGVHGRGIYGFVTTDWQGHGLYLLAEEDLPGTPGYDEPRSSNETTFPAREK